MKRARWASALAFGFVLAAAVPAIAEDGGRVVLVQNPTRLLDTRDAGSNNRVTTATLGSGVLNVVVVDALGPGTATVHRCGVAPAPDVTFRVQNAEPQTARITTGEQLCMTTSVPLHVVVDQYGTVAATPSATGERQYVPLAQPVVLHDAQVNARSSTLRLPHPAELSADGKAVLSIEAINPSAPGFVRVHGCSSVPPVQSDLVYNRNRSANIAFANLAPGEDICVFVLEPVHIRVKLLGELATTGPNAALLPPSWRFTASEVPAPSLRAVTPVRVLDTRKSIGRAGTSRVAPDEVVELDFGSLVGPLTTAVVLNVTVTEPDRAGFLTAWPCGGDRPTVSNLNFDRGDSVPNLVVSKLGPGGTVCLSGIASTHLIADVNGTYEADGGLQAVPVTPTRILDTRTGLGAPAAKLVAGQTLELQVVGNALVDVPAEAGAVTMNVTATDASSAGFLTVYPCGSDRPEASNVNYQVGQSIPNLVMSKLSSTGSVCIYALTDVHVLADVAAWFGVDQPAGLVELPPQRILDTRKAIGTSTTTKVAGGSFITVDVAGQGGVAEDADAVVVNLTATETDAFGFVTAWPCDQSMPTVSNLNYGPAETNPNLATVKLSATGTMCLYSSAGAHLLADVAGYFTAQPVQGQQLTLG